MAGTNMETVWQNIMAAAGGLDGGGALANALGASQVQLGSAQLGVAQMSALNLGAQAAQAQQAIGAAQLGYPGGLSAFFKYGQHRLGANSSIDDAEWYVTYASAEER